MGGISAVETCTNGPSPENPPWSGSSPMGKQLGCLTTANAGLTGLSRKHRVKVGAGSVLSVEEVEQVNKLVETGITLGRQFVQVTPLTHQAARITPSNLPPFISDEFLKDSCAFSRNRRYSGAESGRRGTAGTGKYATRRGTWPVLVRAARTRTRRRWGPPLPLWPRGPFCAGEALVVRFEGGPTVPDEAVAELHAEEKRGLCMSEVSGGSENVVMVVKMNGESGEAGGTVDLTGVVCDLSGVMIDVVCDSNELGTNGEVMGETVELGEAGEPGDMIQTGELGRVSEVIGELGVLGIATGELGEGGVSTGERGERAVSTGERGEGAVSTGERGKGEVVKETHGDRGIEADWEKECEGQALLSHNTTLSGGVGLLFSRGFTPSSLEVEHVREYCRDDGLFSEFCGDLPRVSEETNSRLDRPLQLDELHAALLSMKGGKAPGVDGLMVEFFKAIWDIVAHDMLESLASGSLPLSCRRAVVTLLPKKGNLQEIKNWHPVSLLYQEKAFDRVEHEFLWKVMERFGFSPGFIAMIRVLVNWHKSKALAFGRWTNGLLVLPQDLAWRRDGLKYLGVFIGDE
ncbi:Transposon TX1 uncharacterized 149 kDa protein ORF 2 [Takifugu flavidus]|uniref:Transposon TX1 uncharacterized 149 kDa protein ORF 2 n=1 Tax=Takifugu flavidus TaxID=433684 RepID=A0A5C6NX54_9TELE|nr:Transposon TX1 uncharacterized 149 kDa protein ORF 2 [Takifugu flavidus]